MPALTVIPTFLLLDVGLYRVALAIPSIFFLFWNPQLFRGLAGIPRRTYVLFVSTVLLSIAWFVGGWKFGLEYQGTRFTYLVCRSWKRDLSFPSSLALNWLRFVWLAWYAFPYLGELP
jgi:hypothetical protein